MKFTSSKGETHDFHLDIKAIIEMESADPDFSIMTVADRLDKNLRFTDLVVLAHIVGWELEDFLAHGYTIKNLSEIFVACFEELGFISAQDTPTI